MALYCYLVFILCMWQWIPCEYINTEVLVGRNITFRNSAGFLLQEPITDQVFYAESVQISFNTSITFVITVTSQNVEVMVEVTINYMNNPERNKIQTEREGKSKVKVYDTVTRE